MKQTVSNCVGCSTIFGGCNGSACINYEALEVTCDSCDEYVEEWYEYEDKDYCKDCILQVLEDDEIINKRSYEDL